MKFVCAAAALWALGILAIVKLWPHADSDVVGAIIFVAVFVLGLSIISIVDALSKARRTRRSFYDGVR